MRRPAVLSKWLLILLLPAYPQFLTAQHQREKGELRNGKRDGVWEFFYPDGKLMARERYSLGVLQGEAVSYFPEGQLMQKENWIDDVLQDSAFYYHPNGKLHRKGRYENGVYEGCWITYYPDGNREQFGNYQKGYPEGKFLNWFEDGFLKEEGNYRLGKKSGQFIFYSEKSKGKISILAQYCENSPCGIWVWYKPNGKPDYSAAAPSE